MTVRRVAVLGAGTIGASWAAFFLARGLEVRAWDPAPAVIARRGRPAPACRLAERAAPD